MADCGKCGMFLIRGICETPKHLEPWCQRCAQKHRGEYAPIFAKWVTENASGALADMRVPPAYRTCSFDSFETKTKEQRQALRVAKEWVCSGTPGLFLCGRVGTGKTHLAVSALLAMRGRRWTGQFVSALELLFECRNSFRSGDGPEELMERYSKADVLLLDDLGAEKPSDFSRETLGLIVDRVYRQESCIIVTSNFDFEGLAERIDERTADRLVEMCQAVKLSGSSYRQKRALERANLRNLPASEVVQ